MTILGCVVSVLMRPMAAWSQGMLGMAGRSWRVGVVRYALFQLRIVGCGRMLWMALEMASRGMP